MYKEHIDLRGEKSMIIRVLDGAFIPMDEANTDYQAYLKWVEEGNTPLPADSSTEGATSSVVTEQEGTV